MALLAGVVANAVPAHAEEGPVCQKTGGVTLHEAHERIGDAGKDTIVEPYTTAVSDPVHDPVEATYCTIDPAP
jgi:hypothetical protein